jgi:pyridoxal phosphate enzyme (YggS family)
MTSSLPKGSVSERILQIRQSIPATVTLIAVSKQVPVALMREAYTVGIREQDAIAKQNELQDLPDITWHLIGHLQQNKARKALEHFQWIHSVDDLALAQRLDTLAAELSITPNICLQVKIKPDPNKYGWTVLDLLSDLPALAQCTHLQIQGIMTIPPLDLPDSELLSLFQNADALATQIQQQGGMHLPKLERSMGMSDDYPIAIQAGATMIRLGRALFGDRPELSPINTALHDQK